MNKLTEPTLSSGLRLINIHSQQGLVVKIYLHPIDMEMETVATSVENIPYE